MQPSNLSSLLHLIEHHLRGVRVAVEGEEQMKIEKSARAKQIFAAVVLLMIAGVAPAFAHTIAITSAALDDDHLVISGSGFTGNQLAVTLNGEQLSVLSSTPTMIVAALAPPTPGSYKLIVKAGSAMASTDVPLFSGFRLVAESTVDDQAAALSDTTLLVPTADGLYKISVTLTVAKPGPASGQFWGVLLSSGESPSQEASRFDHGGFLVVDAAAAPGRSSAASWYVKGHAGVPITYKVSPSSPDIGGACKVSITVDEME